jgi:hypothetical protein
LGAAFDFIFQQNGAWQTCLDGKRPKINKEEEGEKTDGQAWRLAAWVSMLLSSLAKNTL